MMPDNEFEKVYRPSATLIIAAFDPCKELGYDYRILLAQRTMSISYAPNHHVFPGGVFDSQADEDSSWLEHFQNMGVSSEDLDVLNLEHLPNRPKPIMTNRRHFSRDISLRITAIRETFEEVGLMVCLRKDQLELPHRGRGTLVSNFNRSYWQKRVHNNSREFLSLCKHLNVVPDLWSLYEWSIWRSPPTSLKRYDTVIYMLTLEDRPEVMLEPKEVERALWVSPEMSLRQFKDHKIWLPPLLYYEISSVSNIFCWSGLMDLLHSRSRIGSTLLMLAYFRCDDALVGTLPFDDFYPANPLEHTATKELPESYIEFEARTQNIHRLICRNMYDLSIVCNISTMDKHLCPISPFKNERGANKL